ncbi:response regulator, partial [Streptococcus suis]
EDDPAVRMLVSDLLGDLGYTVAQAADGREALARLDAMAPVDLLITDVGLPGQINGRQLADAVLEERAGLKVLFITGYAENAVIGNGPLAPNMGLVTKP